MALEVLVPRGNFSNHPPNTVEYFLDACEYWYYHPGCTNLEAFKLIRNITTGVLKLYVPSDNEEKKKVHDDFNKWSKKAAEAIIKKERPKKPFFNSWQYM